MSRIRTTKQAEVVRNAVRSAKAVLGVYDLDEPELAFGLYQMSAFGLTGREHRIFVRLIHKGLSERHAKEALELLNFTAFRQYHEQQFGDAN